MRIAVESPDYRAIMRDIGQGVESAATAAMHETIIRAKQRLRDQIEAAGLGERLAKTWTDKVYPERGESLEPAGVISSRAPGIIDSYLRGATIVAANGRQLLAIPTDDCPRTRQGRAMTPEEVEDRFGRRLQFIDPGDRGFRTPSIRHNAVGYLVMKGLVIRKSSGRWRNASERERAGQTRNPRQVAAVIMFSLVRSVKKPQLLDLAAPAEAWANDYDAALTRKLGQS